MQMNEYYRRWKLLSMVNCHLRSKSRPHSPSEYRVEHLSALYTGPMEAIEWNINEWGRKYANE